MTQLEYLMQFDEDFRNEVLEMVEEHGMTISEAIGELTDGMDPYERYEFFN